MTAFRVRLLLTIRMRPHSQADNVQHISPSSLRQDAVTLVPQSPDTYSNGSITRHEQEKLEIAGDDQEDLGYTRTLVSDHRDQKTLGISVNQMENLATEEDLQTFEKIIIIAIK